MGAQLTSRQRAWGLFALFVAAEALVVALLCLWATPDFASIARYRVSAGDAAAVTVAMPAERDAPMLLYLPHAEGAPVALIDDEAGKPLSSHAEARLTRYLQLLSLRIEASGANPIAPVIALSQSPDHAGVRLGPVYFGPEAALRPVFDSQRRWGRIMQAAIPAAAVFAIGMSLLLIFFARRPSKYMLLIAAFTLQLIIELEFAPTWMGFSLHQYNWFLGVFVQMFIWLAVASWTESKGQGRKFVLICCAVVLASFLTLEIIGREAFPVMAGAGTILHVGWLVLLQILNWRMVLSAKIDSNTARAGTLACFLLSMTGVLSYRALTAGGYSTGMTFFLSNWVNIASCCAVFIFVVGALVNEVQEYRGQRRAVGDLRLAAAGHHVALTEQQQALRDEIERNAVLEERQRFMRELHDGIGNQLLGLMIKMRGQGADAAPLTDDVQAVIAELRLVTTALDQPDGNLAQVLGVMRGRLDAQAANAGVALTWDVRIDPAVATPPKLVLDVLRIVQECISNALKHAGASAIHVAVSGDTRLTVVVADDGAGFDPAAVQAGLGLRNLRARAAAWGGMVEVARGQDGAGTRVTVALAVPVAA